VLLVDHQAGLLSLVRDIEPDTFKNNVLALADLAVYFKLPTILTTSFEDGPNGVLERFPADLNRQDSQKVTDKRVFAHLILLGGRTMPKSYSGDLRERVIEAVAAGASRREAAERFEISPSSAVRWIQCWCETGRSAPKPRGGSTSPLEEHAAQILALVAEQPDLTLEETILVLRKRRIRTSLGSLWRFFDRHDITFKKKYASGGATAR
jgi:transposase